MGKTNGVSHFSISRVCPSTIRTSIFFLLHKQADILAYYSVLGYLGGRSQLLTFSESYGPYVFQTLAFCLRVYNKMV